MTGAEVELVDAVPRYARTITPEVRLYIGLRDRDPLAPLVILLAERYDLDPALGHIEVIEPKKGNRKVYITRDGYLDIAHRSGQLDGIVLEDVSRGESGWRATVSVWRRDMRYPFTYSAGCGDEEVQATAGNGEEMAIARAERRALRRAFRVLTAIERASGLVHDDTDTLTPGDVPPLDAAPDRLPPDWRPSTADQRDAHKAIGALDAEAQDRFRAEWRIEDMSKPWPADAVADALSRRR